MPDTASVVEALRSLVVFGPNQAGAYRELASGVSGQLGEDVPTRLMHWLAEWAESPDAGLVILTGNAGTGKTAATEHFCRLLGQTLPDTDEMTELAGAFVVKDASGIGSRQERAAMFERAMANRRDSKVLLCVNEGILRDAAEDLASTAPFISDGLNSALRDGAHTRDGITVLNLNRQRLTDKVLWDQLVDYVTREELWRGCEDCPGGEDDNVCPMRANASALRQPYARQVLRRLIQVCSGEMTPTIRELLSLIAYAVVGAGRTEASAQTWTCPDVVQRYRDRGSAGFTADSAFYNLILGEGIDEETRERSPLLDALQRLACGFSSDLQVDGWLRDPTQMPEESSALSGLPQLGDNRPLSGSTPHLDRIRTEIGERSFAEIGEIAAISEDHHQVQACIQALVQGSPAAITSWRRRILFEAAADLGGPDHAVDRLTSLTFATELLGLAETVANGDRTLDKLIELVSGLNFLATGQSTSGEGLIVPDPASLFARKPGAFRSALPAFVAARVPLARLRLAIPDRGIVEDYLDVDHVEVTLSIDSLSEPQLTIGPRLFQAISEARLYRGPVGHGTAEMTDLRSFYGRLADLDDLERERHPLVADPGHAGLVQVQPPIPQL